MDRTFEDTKQEMLQFASDINNSALYQAVGFCRNWADLATTVRQAHGAGSDCFKTAYAYIQEHIEE